MPDARRVVVSGIGVLSGSLQGVEPFWASLLDPPERPPRRILGFDARDFMDRREAQRASRFAQIAVAAGQLARLDAGTFDDDPERVGVVMGASMADLPMVEESFRSLRTGGASEVSVHFGTRVMANAGSSMLAWSLRSKGVTYSVASGCTSGTHAVGEAFRLVRDGRADVAYGGGSDALLSSDDPTEDLITAGLLALRVHTTEDRARPFDRDRQGFVFAEGAAVLRLEVLEAAQARGARIYAEVLGAGNTVDAYDLVQPAPRGEGLQRCLRNAMAEAGRDLSEVGHVNCHATATLHNDQAESDAIVDLFGLPTPAVNGTKGSTGHAGAASGAIEAAEIALATHHRLVPPTAGCENVDPAVEADVVIGQPRAWSPGLAISTGTGLGGQNGVLVMGPAPA